MADRAIVFVDGSNWYHSLRAIGARLLGRLNYASVSKKIAQHRDWLATRYYIGQVEHRGRSELYSEQRRFLARLTRTDSRITTHLGRLESRRTDSQAARALLQYLQGLETRIERTVYRDLIDLARRHRDAEVVIEKAVDVMIAVDMVVMSERDEFDTAYLLSADGDFTPAVNAVRSHGKAVFAVSGQPGARLRGACNAFIRVDLEWLRDCYEGHA